MPHGRLPAAGLRLAPAVINLDYPSPFVCREYLTSRTGLVLTSRPRGTKKPVGPPAAVAPVSVSEHTAAVPERSIPMYVAAMPCAAENPSPEDILHEPPDQQKSSHAPQGPHRAVCAAAAATLAVATETAATGAQPPSHQSKGNRSLTRSVRRCEPGGRR